ncbi:MAG TPA: glycosyltransferase family 4 protein [Bacteroidales bacterium]
MDKYLLLIYLGAFLISLLLTWVVRHWAIKKSIIDHPNERSSHTIPTPRGGGLAIAITWFVGLIVLFAYNQIETNLFWALIAGLPLPFIGFLDDIFSLKPGIRSLIQLLSAILGIAILGGLKYLDIGFTTLEWKWIFTPLAVIGIVWAINLFNFLDGTDGYCSMEAIFISAALIILIAFSPVLALFIACVAGFLFWNWPKAKIFMGDVGSTLIGYNVAIFAIYYQNEHKLSLIVFLIISAVFWFDATLTLIRRIRNKEKLSIAHRKHAFQRFVQAGFSHQDLLIGQFIVNLFLLLIAYFCMLYPTYSLFFLLLSIILIFAPIKFIDKKKPFEFENLK